MDTHEQARQHFMQGAQHFENGALEAARDEFEAARALAPERASVLGNLGITLFHLRCHDDAVPLLERATAADPEYGEAWIALGLSHETTGRWGEAAAALERGLALVPPHAPLWLSFGQCIARLGHPREALQAFERAVELDPALGAAWSARGGILRDLYRFTEAAQSFEQALAHGADPELNHYYLAAVQGGPMPSAPPRHYVEGLFDDYSGDFETHLVEQLHYRGHERLIEPLLARNERYENVIDLGCGTGLCARLIASHADTIDGVDLSRAMLDQARASGAYRHLDHADIATYLAQRTEPVDLVLAADVFIYVGELDGVFAQVRRLLRAGGCFAFTVEQPETGEEGVHLLPSLRYAHSESYVRTLAARHGFEVRALQRAPLRDHADGAVDALYVYLQ